MPKFTSHSVQTFNNWMDNTLDDLAETAVCSSISDVEELQSKHEQFKQTDLQDANGKYEELNNLVTEMAELGSSDNPYTALSAQVSVKNTVGYVLQKIYLQPTSQIQSLVTTTTVYILCVWS